LIQIEKYVIKQPHFKGHPIAAAHQVTRRAVRRVSAFTPSIPDPQSSILAPNTPLRKNNRLLTPKPPGARLVKPRKKLATFYAATPSKEHLVGHAVRADTRSTTRQDDTPSVSYNSLNPRS
jgi:hypothetical protein